MPNTLNDTFNKTKSGAYNDKVIIDVSDMLVRATYRGNEFYAQPGIALLPQNSETVIGQQALLSFKQQPTRIQSRYWSNLNTEPLGLSDTPIRHNADLVWHQLSQIKQLLLERDNGKALDSSNANFIFITPTNFSSDQMQLLAGICQSLGIIIDFFTDQALTDLIAVKLAGNIETTDNQLLVHANSQFNHLLLSFYRINDDTLELVEYETHKDLSLVRLIDHLLHLLSEKFIQHSRFDPLHSGETEQQLFDQLIPFLTHKDQPFATVFTIETNKKSHQIELGQKELQEVNTVISGYINEVIQRSDQLAKAAGQRPSSGDLINNVFCSSLIKLSGSENYSIPLVNTIQPLSLHREKQDEKDIAYISSYSGYKSVLSSDTSSESENISAPDKTVPNSSAQTEALSANALVVNNRVFTHSAQSGLEKLGFTSTLFTWDDQSLLAASTDLSINAEPAAIGQLIRTGDQLAVPHSGLTALAVRMAI